MSIVKKASAHWEGDLKTGKGKLNTPQSGLLADTRYGFNSRFGDEKGTNPEELLAVAHAGCFTMALSAVLGKAGFTPDKLQTRAEATMEPGMDPGPTITAIKLTVSASVPGISAAQFEEIAQQAKAGCVISRALSVPVSLEATLL